MDVIADGIRDVLRSHANLGVDIDQISPETDLFDSGMDSHSSVMVMLALEERFEIEFPDRMLRREVFQSIDALEGAIAEIGVDSAAG